MNAFYFNIKSTIGGLEFQFIKRMVKFPFEDLFKVLGVDIKGMQVNKYFCFLFVESISKALLTKHLDILSFSITK